MCCKVINGEILKNAVISGANNISVQKNRINDLNIFHIGFPPAHDSTRQAGFYGYHFPREQKTFGVPLSS